MAVRIRMKKLGRRHRPFFRICAMDSRKPRDGTAIEELGYYDPMVREKSQRVQLNLERVEYWLSVGAQPSEKVAALIKKVKTNTWGQAAEPPPLTPPKAPSSPEPEPQTEAEAAAEETAVQETTEETTEAAAEEESPKQEAPTEESAQTQEATDETAKAEEQPTEETRADE